jgi:hypothetical protein
MLTDNIIIDIVIDIFGIPIIEILIFFEFEF